MNSLEGNRIINVLDDAIVNLRILSRVTEAVFDRGDFENAGFPDEFLDLLDTHRSIIQANRSDIQSEQVFKSTTDVLRAIHASPRERALFTGPVLEPSEAMQDVVNLFMRLREIMKQSLDMTVEEERSRNEQSMETKERLERNEKERSSLMAALKMEREERERESAELDRLEERLKADTKVVTDRFRRAMVDTDEVEAREREEDAVHCRMEKERLEKERDDLLRRLRATRERHANLELQEKTKKGQAMNYLQDALKDYDALMTEKQGQYEEHQLASDKEAQLVQDMTTMTELMRDERVKFEKAERDRMKEELKLAMRKIRQDMAVDVVQAWWRTVLDSRKGKKGKKKGKK